jgi:hypothetical protein
MLIDLKEKRFEKTLNFLAKYEPHAHRILDLGVRNPLSERMEKFGYEVINTQGEDLDLTPETIAQYKDVDVVTAFEILEHLVSPFPVLRLLPAHELVVTVPLSLWFSKTYRNRTDKFDMHYHEFEDWQFDMLLEKAGWKIIHREKWTAPTYQIGIRPILRFFYPRFYAVHAVRAD